MSIETVLELAETSQTRKLVGLFGLGIDGKFPHELSGVANGGDGSLFRMSYAAFN